jgi:hypothetical protein
MITAVAASGPPCSPLDPSLCGPTPAEGLTLGLLLAAPILLLPSPATGYAVAVAGAVLAGATTPAPGQAVFGLFAALCAGLLAQLLLLRRRQWQSLPTVPNPAAPSAAGPGSTVPVGPMPAPAALSTPWRGRAGAAAALVAVAVGCLIGYSVSTSALATQLARSTVVDAVVQATDSDASEITVQLPDAATRILSVADTGIYRVGEPVPVHLDATQRPPWVALVAEPDDLTWWQSLAVIATLFAGVALARPVREWRRGGWRRAGVRSGAVVRMELLRHGIRGDTTLSIPGDGEPLARLRISMTVEKPHDADDEDNGDYWDDDEDLDPYMVGGSDDPWYTLDPRFDDAWYDDGRFDSRDDPDGDHFDPDDDNDEPPAPVPVSVAGEWYYGGVVTVTTADGDRIARGRLTVPRQQPSVEHEPAQERGGARPGWLRRAFHRWYARDGQTVEQAALPVERTVDLDEVRLPVIFRAPNSARWTGAAMVAGAAILAIATPPVAHAHFDAWAALWALSTGWGLWTRGTAVLLGRLVADDRELRIITTARERRVPWRLLAPVNEFDDTAVVTWYPGMGRFTGRVEQSTDVAALLETLRRRAIDRGEPRRPARSRWRPTLLVPIVYPAAFALLWWSLYR